MARRPKPPRKPNAAEWLFVVHKRQSELSLWKFIQLFWHAVEPKRPLTPGWPMIAICKHLEAVERGEIKRLIINVPPGSSKSLITNVFYPAWIWGPLRQPEMRFLTAAYSQGLTERDNERMRQLVNSDLYKAMWGNVFIPGDNKVKFQNSRFGFKLASSIGGTITGERADRVICLPFWALIVTDAGLLPIGPIVHAKLPVRVAGWSGTAVEWQDIEAYEVNPSGRLIQIEHDAGVLRCTDDHPVWVEGRGYVAAADVEPGDRLLHCMLEAVQARTVCHQGDSEREEEGANLLSGMPGEAPELPYAVYLPSLRQGIHAEAGARCHEQILLEGLPVQATAARSAASACSDRLLELRQAIRSAALSAEVGTSSQLLEGVRNGNQATDITSKASETAPRKAGGTQDLYLPSLLQDLSEESVAGQRQAGSFLLQEMHILRGRTGQLPVSRGLEHTPQDQDQEARQSYLSALPLGLDAQSNQTPCASHRLRREQLGPEQPDIALQGMPSQEGPRQPALRAISGGVAVSVVRSVGYVDDVPAVTYNVRVAPHHNYFAEGVLVHNCDDPNSVHEAESATIRENTNRWLHETLPTRLNDPVESAIIVIQQRTHAEDATGTLLDPERGGDEWVHLMIPARYDPGRHCTTPIGWSDPRGHDEHGNPLDDPWENEGAPFWPERFPEDEMEKLEAKLGPYAWSGQMQQMPTPRGGAIIRAEAWQQYGPDDPIKHGLKFPPFSLLVGFVDTAYTTKEQNDPSAMTIMGVWTHPTTGFQQVMLVHAWQARLPLHELVQRVAASAKKYRIDALLIENKAAGISLQQEMARLFSRSDFTVRLVDPTSQGSKEARAHSVTHLFDEGMVYAPATEWADMVIQQAAQFPRGAHDDLVDCVVSTLRYMRDTGLLNRKQEAKWEEADLHESYRNEGAARPLY